MAITPHTTRSPGTILTAAIYNEDHERHVVNASGVVQDATDALEGAEAARDKAQEWAENPEDVEVETNQFSALHHATKAIGSADAAATSEANAASSESAAVAAASDAATSEANASADASAASASAGEASTSQAAAAASASAASDSETNAAASATAAEGFKDDAEAAATLAGQHKDAASDHRDAAETAQNAAENASATATTAASAAQAAQSDAQDASDAAQDASATAVSASNAAQAHRTAAEIARDEAEAAAVIAQAGTAVSMLLPETQLWINACPEPPVVMRSLLMDHVIQRLKETGIWDRLDALYLLAAHGEGSSLINVRSPGNFDLTVNGSPTFAANRGFTGAASAWLNTGFNPTTAGGGFTQNTAHAGVFVLSNLADGGPVMGQDNPSRIRLTPRSAGGNLVTRLNQGVNSSNSVATSAGHSMVRRDSATSVRAVKNGSSFASETVSSEAMHSSNIRLLAESTSVFTTHELAAAHFGNSLVNAMLSPMHEILEFYLTEVGAL